MASKKVLLIIFVLYFNNVQSATLIERSYEYVLTLGKSLAPSFMSILNCFGEDDAWGCAREKAGQMLDSWDKDVNKQRRLWQEAADAEVTSSGRSFAEMPSKLGQEIEGSLTDLSEIIQKGVARAMSRTKHESGGIDSITISASSEKKKMKNKKQKPTKIQLIQPVMMPMKKMEEKGRGFEAGRVQSWVVGNNTLRKGRGFLSDLWGVGEKALDAMADHAIDSENAENGIADRSSVEEQRGKKKKKKKAILKLLILGAVLKAKIGTLLQILSFKLQVKFFIIALIGLAINLARFWVELKNKHQQQPQKVIYYEHAQHQHHYEHEEEPAGWGPWSRSMEPEETEPELENVNSPYRAHERNTQVYPTRPLLTLS